MDVTSFTGMNKVKDPQLWNGFRRSIKAADKQRRHTAKCCKCNASFLGTRANLLMHRSKCTPASVFQILQAHSSDPLVIATPSPPAMDKQREVDEMLAKALVIGDIPFRLLDNKMFLKWQAALVDMGASGVLHRPLSASRLRGETLVHMATAIDDRQCRMIEEHEHWCVSLAKWKDDGAGLSYCAVMLRDQKRTLHLDNLELDDVNRRTLKQVVGNYSARIKAIVSDSPDTMQQMREDLAAEQFDSVLQLGCTRHVIESICQSLFTRHAMKPTISKLARLAAFFTASDNDWSCHLTDWASHHNVGPLAASPVERRWSSCVQLCASVAAYEAGFVEAVQLFRHGLLGLEMPEDVVAIVEDGATFRDAHFLVTITKALAEAIECVERDSAHLGDVLVALLSAQRYLDEIRDQVDVSPAHHQSWFAQVEYSLNVHTKSLHGIHTVALFLRPPYRRMCVSKIAVSALVLELAQKWNFSEFEAVQLYDSEIPAYFNNSGAHHCGEQDPIKYWGALRQVSPCLAKLAEIVFAIVPVSVSVGPLKRSELGRSKNKNMGRSRISQNIAKIKLDYFNKRESPPPSPEGGWSYAALEDLVEASDVDDDADDHVPTNTFIKDSFNYDDPLFDSADLDTSAEPPLPKRAKWSVKDIIRD